MRKEPLTGLATPFPNANVASIRLPVALACAALQVEVDPCLEPAPLLPSSSPSSPSVSPNSRGEKSLLAARTTSTNPGQPFYALMSCRTPAPEHARRLCIVPQSNTANPTTPLQPIRVQGNGPYPKPWQKCAGARHSCAILRCTAATSTASPPLSPKTLTPPEPTPRGRIVPAPDNGSAQEVA